MELMAESWTEKRLDDLKAQVDRLERRTDEGFRDQRAEMDRRFDRAEARVDSRFEAVDKRFDAVDKRFDAVDKRFDALEDRFYAIHRTLILFAASMFAAMLGLFATQL